MICKDCKKQFDFHSMTDGLCDGCNTDGVTLSECCGALIVDDIQLCSECMEHI